jgi:crossover junction endodeoxyribonuclease RusA
VSAPTLFTPEVPAASAAGAPGPYVIALPAGLDLINANQRMHEKARARLTKKIRDAAHEAVTECPTIMAALAAAKPGPLFQRAHILGVLCPSTYGRRRDPANWYGSFKAAVDGLVDAGLFDDDDHTRVVGPDMRLGEKVKGGQIVLVVRGLAPGEDPLGYQVVSS